MYTCIYIYIHIIIIYIKLVQTMFYKRTHHNHYPFGTHRSTRMAFCSSFIAYTDYSTDTIAELSIPTSQPAPSIINGSIYGSSR